MAAFLNLGLSSFPICSMERLVGVGRWGVQPNSSQIPSTDTAKPSVFQVLQGKELYAELFKSFNNKEN